MAEPPWFLSMPGKRLALDCSTSSSARSSSRATICSAFSEPSRAAAPEPSPAHAAVAGVHRTSRISQHLQPALHCLWCFQMIPLTARPGVSRLLCGLYGSGRQAVEELGMPPPQDVTAGTGQWHAVTQPVLRRHLAAIVCMQDASKMHATPAFASWPPFKYGTCQTRCINSCSCGHGALTAV